jgi:hypothetical protein
VSARLNIDTHTPSSFLVLDGWEDSVFFDPLIECTYQHFSKAGISPNIVSVKTVYHENIKDYSLMSFRKGISGGILKDFSVLSLIHLRKRGDKSSGVFDITFMDIRGVRNAYILDAVSNNPLSIALDFLSDALKFISPNYGYLIEISLEENPILFSQGIFARTSHSRREANAWQDASHAALGKSLQKHGKFRHVFAVNVLSPPHLANVVDDRLFADWVSDTGFGRLEQWKDNVWVWFVPHACRIPAAIVLQRNGLLTAPPGFETELIG